MNPTCFNFESQYRGNGDVFSLYFSTTDSTEWKMSEKWSEFKPIGEAVQHKITFEKLKTFEGHYDIEIRVYPTGNDHFLHHDVRRAKPVRTTFYTRLLNAHRVDVQAHIFRFRVRILKVHGEPPLVPRLDNWRTFSHQLSLIRYSKSWNDIFTNDHFTNTSAMGEQRVLFIHKCILACRSGTFRRLYENETRHPREHDTETYLETGILFEMLKLIYEGHTPDGDITISSLFSAACIFEMEDFKVTLRNIIERNIDPFKAVFLLGFAYECEDYPLKEICIDCIARNFYSVKLHGSWNELTKQQQKDVLKRRQILDEEELHGSPELPKKRLLGKKL